MILEFTFYLHQSISLFVLITYVISKEKNTGMHKELTYNSNTSNRIDFIYITIFYEKESKRRMNEIVYLKQTENLINVNLIILLNGILFLWDI